MPEFVLIDGDEVNFDKPFPPAKVDVQPGRLIASGPATQGGKHVCVEGDEKRVIVPGCTYSTPQFSTPGVGILEIAALAPDQKSMKTKSGGKPVLLVGKKFTAKFTVMVPAQYIPPSPAPPVPDPNGQYSGTGEFKTHNSLFREV